MDTDFYYRSYLKYGLPHFIKELLVSSCIHRDSVSFSIVNDDIVQKERIIVKEKYDSYGNL